MRPLIANYRLFFAGITIGTVAIATSHAESQILSGFEWKNRPLVVCDLKSNLKGIDETEMTDDFEQPEFDYVNSGIEIFAKDQSDRKLALVIIARKTWMTREWGPEGGPDTSSEAGPITVLASSGIRKEDGEFERLAIARRVGCEPGDQMMALIGLDGGLKQSWRDAPPKPAEVFALIDAMPMRRQELRQAADE
ncbi:MAG: DUF4174 domain-containing protein [Pseudomonadota bacterium]